MSAWPHTGTPGAGTLAECELDAACWRKQTVILTRAQTEGTDEMSDAACSACNGRCGTPYACLLPEQREAEGKRLMRSAWKWFAAGAVVALALIVWSVRHA